MSKIISTASYLPRLRVENAELTQFPKSAIPLIERKTGVKSRHYASPAESTSDLAAAAARACLAGAGLAVDRVDALILATSSPDRPIPATATRVQALIGAHRAFAFDVNAVCSGSIYALAIADSMIESGSCHNIIVVAAEVYSRILNPLDFATYPYFGDGAGALLLQRADGERGIVRTLLRSDGRGADLIQIPAGGAMMPAHATNEQKNMYFTMNGREVFEFATREGAQIIKRLLDETNISRDAVGHVVLHQANINIIDEISRRTEISRDRFFVNLDRVGNTAAASVMIGLSELIESGAGRPGDLVILASFGGGLAWGASLVRL